VKAWYKMDEKLKKFCENYEVKIVNDQKRYARYRRPQFFTEPLNASIIQDTMDFQTEKLYTVDIPESRLNTLVEMENRFMNFRNSDHSRDMFELLMDKEREEAHYRFTNEAVKKAYEQYSIMLNLAGYQRRI
jgi:hypothetical protein